MTEIPEIEGFRARLFARMQAKNISARALSLKAGLGDTAVKQILQGRSANPRIDTAISLAKALGCSLGELLGLEPSPPSPIHSTVEIVGTIQAGFFRSTLEEPEFDRELAIIPPSNRYPGAPRFALRVRGSSMNQKLPDGSLAICVRYSDIGAIPQSGELVICQRAGMGGTIEATCKEFVVESDGTAYLWPRSTDPDHQHPYKLVQDAGDVDIADDWGDILGPVQARQLGKDEVDQFEIVAKVISYQQDNL